MPPVFLLRRESHETHIMLVKSVICNERRNAGRRRPTPGRHLPLGPKPATHILPNNNASHHQQGRSRARRPGGGGRSSGQRKRRHGAGHRDGGHHTDGRHAGGRGARRRNPPGARQEHAGVVAAGGRRMAGSPRGQRVVDGRGRGRQKQVVARRGAGRRPRRGRAKRRERRRPGLARGRKPGRRGARGRAGEVRRRVARRCAPAREGHRGGARLDAQAEAEQGAPRQQLRGAHKTEVAAVEGYGFHVRVRPGMCLCGVSLGNVSSPVDQVRPLDAHGRSDRAVFFSRVAADSHLLHSLRYFLPHFLDECSCQGRLRRTQAVPLAVLGSKVPQQTLLEGIRVSKLAWISGHGLSGFTDDVQRYRPRRKHFRGRQDGCRLRWKQGAVWPPRMGAILFNYSLVGLSRVAEISVQIVYDSLRDASGMF